MNAILGSINAKPSQVVVGTHPPIVSTMAAKVNNGSLAEGLLIAKDANGDLVAYDPVGVAPVNAVKGVVINECDTTTEASALVIRHGTVRLASLIVGAGAPAATDLEALAAIGIFAS